jgi:hypothetical protein
MRKLKGGNAAIIDTNSNVLGSLKRCSRPEKMRENPEGFSLIAEGKIGGYAAWICFG